MSASAHNGLDEYELTHLAEHLYRAGPELYPDLYYVTTSRRWFDAQSAFDPSRRTYAESLEWTVRAAQADPHGLPALLVTTLLRPTVNVLAAQVPTAALEMMARLGSAQRAESYAGLRSDAPSRCEALCRIADARCEHGDTMGSRDTLLRARREAAAITNAGMRIEALCRIARALLKSDDEEGARETLRQAERQTLSLKDERSWTHLLATVAVAAREIGVPDTLDRAVLAVRTAFERDRKSQAAAIARELELFDRPDYLLALAEPDPEKVWYRVTFDPLAVVARLAAAQKDHALLDAILAQAQREIGAPWTPEAIVEALTEAGRVDDAFGLIETWRRHHGPDDLELREALARAAGRCGDLRTIERAASPAYSKGDTSDAGDSPDWEERFGRIAGSVLHSVKRAGWRVAGMGDFEKLTVMLGGMEALADKHPEQARALWERAKVEKGWAWRQWAPALEKFYFEHLGIGRSQQLTRTEHEQLFRPPAGLAGVLFRLGGLAARWADETDEADEPAELMAELGHFERALELAGEIDNPNRRGSVLTGIARAALEMGDIRQAMAVAEKIDEPIARRRVLDWAAEALSGLPRDEAVRLLDPFAAQADRLDEQESLVCAQALPALMREVARFASVEDALSMVQSLGPDAILAVLPALCEVTVIQGDSESAQQLMARAEQASAGGDLAKALAQMSAQWAKAAAADGQSVLTKRWSDLAAQAFRLALSQTKRLQPELERRWILPSLALAARHLRDKSALRALQKQAKALVRTQWVVNQSLADQVLIQVVMGLASPDYLGLPVIEEIWNREYRAQVQVEMSEAVRSLPPQKTLFWTHRSEEDLQFWADLLLNNAREELTFKGQDMSHQFRYKKAHGLRLDGQPSTKAAVDDRSIFVRMGQESRSGFEFVAPKPRPEEQVLLEESGRNALARVFGALASADRHNDIVQIAQNTQPPSDQPVIAAAVTALAQAGQVGLARRLLQNLKSAKDRALALAGLACGLAASNADQAKACLDQAVRLLPESPHSEMTLPAIADVARTLPPPVRVRVLHDVLRAGREQGRAGALRVIASLTPALVTLMDATQWRETAERIIEMESWWRHDL